MVREIPLTKGFVALVDDEDFERANQFKWYVRIDRKTNYARRTRKNCRPCTEYLHRFLMNAKPGQEVDHRNGNGLDCRRENMRWANRHQQMVNLQHRPNQYGFRGVHKHPRCERWIAKVTVNRKRILSCGHLTPESAARAYDAMAREIHGAFAVLNFPEAGERGVA